MNRLYYGDCLTIMQQELGSQSVDLIYLDPPFNSNRSYNAIYKDETGRPLPDQVEAFCDLWTLDEETERAIRTMPVLMREAGIADETVEFWRLWMNALRASNPRMLAYLSYMVQRLAVMKRLLRPAGSIYLHCDPTASHYIKVMMDGIFGHGGFLSEIIWKRTSAHSGARRAGPVHDVILHYARSDKWIWNTQLQPYDPEYIENHYRYQDDAGRRYRIGDLTGAGTRSGDSGKEWRGYDPTDAGRHWAVPSTVPKWSVLPDRFGAMSVQERLDSLDDVGLIHWPKKGKVPAFRRYLDQYGGVALQDVWTDIPIALGKERMGYATQKPLALLERIIRASTNEGDVVLDPFCGCATTLEAAHKLGRQWIGIDIAIHAIKRVAAIRLGERCKLKEDVDFTIAGVPQTLEGAKDLWHRDKYHFQKWAVEEVDGFVTTKRTADGGIDGRLYFDVPGERELKSMVLEVKGGKNVTIADLRALHSVLEREEAVMAGLIVMEPLGDRKMQNFQKLMSEAGDLEVARTARPYPRMQILSVPEILEGKRFDTHTPMGRALHPQKQLAI